MQSGGSVSLTHQMGQNATHGPMPFHFITATTAYQYTYFLLHSNSTHGQHFLSKKTRIAGTREREQEANSDEAAAASTGFHTNEPTYERRIRLEGCHLLSKIEMGEPNDGGGRGLHIVVVVGGLRLSGREMGRWNGGGGKVQVLMYR
ncbi:hypothetical protein NE237_018780 [Protea cynaroides]|uniref:Uncharacterized protein n=1 Tax=Protea cynaroides TaxID=273540 RepID=A0A9Q0KAR4_9MAGN|nr:hypothetical protein NE237_018780 [Protea cynaroides]